MATIAAFMGWLEADLGRGVSLCNHIETVSSPLEMAQGRVVLRLYTESSCYEIVAVAGRARDVRPSTLADGYEILVEAGKRVISATTLSARVTARKPRAGEQVPRSRSLTSGALTPETWRLILGDIIACELVRLHASPLDPEPARAAMGGMEATITAAQADRAVRLRPATGVLIESQRMSQIRNPCRG